MSRNARPPAPESIQMSFLEAWTRSIEDALCVGALGADRDDVREILRRYEPDLRALRGHFVAGEMDLWLLLARTVEDDIAIFAGPLGHVMSAIGRHSAFRITLVPLAIAAERIRYLAETG